MDAFILISNLLRPLVERTSPQTDRPFSTILEATAVKKCQDERDKIFALFTVFERLGMDLAPPNYSDSCEKVTSQAFSRVLLVPWEHSLTANRTRNRLPKVLTGHSMVSARIPWPPQWLLR